jgi:hypothetical protein
LIIYFHFCTAPARDYEENKNDSQLKVDNVIDFPDPSVNVPVEDLYLDSCTLTWPTPENDDGFPMSHKSMDCEQPTAEAPSSSGTLAAKDPFDPPSQPGVPEVTETRSKDTVALKSTAPDSNGGSPVSHESMDCEEPTAEAPSSLGTLAAKDPFDPPSQPDVPEVTETKSKDTVTLKSKAPDSNGGSTMRLRAWTVYNLHQQQMKDLKCDSIFITC